MVLLQLTWFQDYLALQALETQLAGALRPEVGFDFGGQLDDAALEDLIGARRAFEAHLSLTSVLVRNT